MPKSTWTIQTNMNRGEATPLVDGRKELDLYYNSCQEAKNVLSLPQGGLVKRAGTQTIAHINNLIRTEPFSFNTEQNYLMAFASERLYIYKEKLYQTDFSVPYSATQIQELTIIQSADTAVLFHEDVQTRLVTRTSDTAWTITVSCVQYLSITHVSISILTTLLRNFTPEVFRIFIT